MICLPSPHPRHSLAHYSQRTLTLLEALEDYPYMVSGSLNSLSRVLFNFPSRYLYAIGLSTCLRLEVDASHLPAPFPRDSTQDTFSALSTLTTGLSPSLARRSRRLCRIERSLNESPYHTTCLASFNARFGLSYAVFSRSYSPYPYWFLFLGVLRRFNSPRSPTLRS